MLTGPSLQGNTNPFIDAHLDGGGPATSPPIIARSAELATLGTNVRIAAWNIANLHFENDVHLPGRPTAASRSQSDFDRLARYASELNADIIALQEVNGPEAVARVFPENEYYIIVSSRFEEDQISGRDTDHIYTGFAVRKNSGLTLVASQTYSDLSIPHSENGQTRPTRRAVEILVELPNGEPLQVLSVHLKSGCHQGRLDVTTRPACLTLAAQRAPLETWIDTLTLDGTPFIIAGDWNRRLDIHGEQDHLWEEIDDRDPSPLELFRFPEGIDSPCLSSTPRHRPKPIDFIVADEQAARWIDPESVTILDFDAADKPETHQISDHCPVFVDLRF